MNTDRDWENWGNSNPYYGVISHDKYMGETLSSVAQEQFFKSGQQTVERILKHVNAFRGQGKGKFDCAVDYGCGVGRLSLALGSHAKKVVGLDVAPSMIKHAKAAAGPVKNVEYKVVDKKLSALPKSYDLLVSFIVFQHIPPRRGMKLINTLLANLQPDGCFALQLTYSHDKSILGKTMVRVRERLPFVRYVGNIAKGRKFNTPNMKMHVYDLNAIHRVLQENGIVHYSAEFTDHGRYLGVFLYGKKTERHTT